MDLFRVETKILKESPYIRGSHEVIKEWSSTTSVVLGCELTLYKITK
jgi:hypothetical protein